MALVIGSTASNPDSGYKFNVKDYGAKGDYPTTDDTTAIQNAVNALKALGGGGELFFPPGLYKVSSSLDFSGLKDCRIRGYAGRNNNGTGSNPATMIYNTGQNTGDVVNLKDCNGIVWDGVSVWSNANGGGLSGVLMNFDATVSGLTTEHDIFGNRVQNCAFRIVQGTSPKIVTLATAIEVSFDNVTFGDAGTAGTQVRMVDTSGAGHWSNANSFRSCSFLGSRSVSVQDPATQTTFIDCTFEPTTGNVPAPIRVDNLGNEAASVLSFTGCGFWDNTGTGGSWIKTTVATSALSMVGCKVQIGPGGVAFDLSAHTGLALVGCRFDAANGGTPNIFTPAQNITNGSMIGCQVVSPVVDNHASVFV